MGPVPSLSAYQAAASAIYEPQKAAEAASINATNQTTKNSLESEKNQINTDYQSAINNLNYNTQANEAKINQLYSERLGGNFSGLQANDAGQMFAHANQLQSTIEQTRANKLNDIAVEETNADITANTELNNLTPKYAAMETQYAQGGYASALKDYNDTQFKLAELNSTNSYRDAELGLREQEIANSEQNRADSIAGQYKVKQLSSGNKTYTGPNGQTNLYTYAYNVAQGDKSQAYNIIKQELKSGSQTDQGAYSGMLRLEKKGLSQDQILQSLAKSNPYIFG